MFGALKPGLSKLIFFYSEYMANLNRKEQLRHRAVSLRQYGFLVLFDCNFTSITGPHLALMFHGTNPRPSLILVATE